MSDPWRSLKAKKLQWREEGLCVACGQGRSGRTLYCYFHRKYQREYRAKRRLERRKLGICIECTDAATRAGLCAAHHKKMQERLAHAYEQRKIPL